jgi:hypothetical protein
MPTDAMLAGLDVGRATPTSTLCETLEPTPATTPAQP